MWSDNAKVAPPPLSATLQLQHVSEEGWQTLQEIKDLSALKTPQGSGGKKSRRKPSSTTRIWQEGEDDDADDTVDIDFDTYGASEEEGLDSDDDDYDPEPEQDDDEQDEEYTPEKESVKVSKRKQGAVRRVARRQTIKTEPVDDDDEIHDEDDEDEANKDDAESGDGSSEPKVWYSHNINEIGLWPNMCLNDECRRLIHFRD